MMGEVRGTLFVAQSIGPGMVGEEQVPFRDLQELLDACAAREEGGALVRVEIVGASAGERRRLVLDFGQFGHDEG
jgi:hypothetical protein